MRRLLKDQREHAAHFDDLYRLFGDRRHELLLRHDCSEFQQRGERVLEHCFRCADSSPVIMRESRARLAEIKKQLASLKEPNLPGQAFSLSRSEFCRAADRRSERDETTTQHFQSGKPSVQPSQILFGPLYSKVLMLPRLSYFQPQHALSRPTQESRRTSNSMA
jgi:hypothetical protein